MKNIIEVSELNFESEVIVYSKSTPVVVDFWAEWCHPCKSLNQILEKLIVEMVGKFRLARLNVDENPNLAIQFNVNSLPTIKAVSNGSVVGELMGSQSENKVREFLVKMAPPNPANLEIEKGQSFLRDHKWNEAEFIFRRVLETQPEFPAALLGLSICLLAQNQPEEAEAILHTFPTSREYSSAQILLPYAEFLLADRNPGNGSGSDVDIAFNKSIEFARKGKLELAIEGLLDVLRVDIDYRKGLPKQIILALLELMGPENTETRIYRSEFATILH